MFSHITFDHSWVLGLLLLIPILAFEYVRRYQRMSASMMLTTTHFLSRTNWRIRLRHSLFVMRCLTLILLIIALAKPQIKFSENQIEQEGIDIVLCFDISGSMTEKDLLPNRLEAAKAVATSFVNQRQGDRLGVVIFSNQSFTLCPLTIDKNTVLNQIRNIQSGYLQDEGTAIGSGLATSVDRLRQSKSTSKLVVLLTDGIDFGGDVPISTALDLAKKFNIKVYTIGVGANNFNNNTSPNPQEKVAGFNASLLKTLAQETGGQFFLASDNDALQKVYASINQLEKTKALSTDYSYEVDKYHPLVFLALILLTIEIVLRYTIFRTFP